MRRGISARKTTSHASDTHTLKLLSASVEVRLKALLGKRGTDVNRKTRLHHFCANY